MLYRDIADEWQGPRPSAGQPVRCHAVTAPLLFACALLPPLLFSQVRDFRRQILGTQFRSLAEIEITEGN